MSEVSIAEENQTAAENQLAIQTQNLSKQFLGDFAVKDVTFQVPYGIIFGFIGPSGSGKTTTVRLLTGIYEPTTGIASVLGKQPRHFDAHTRDKIGYLPQHFVLYPDLSVWENLNFAASLYGMNLLKRKRRLISLLKFVELENDSHKLARNISGGMQRRLSLASTLIHDPQLIFLDEPTAGIDPVLRSKFWDHFKELRNNGRTLFITTQYVSEASYCDFVGVIDEGRMLVVDTPEGLRKRAYGGDVIELQSPKPIGFDTIFSIQNLEYVRGRVHSIGENTMRITVDDASKRIPELIEWCNEHNLPVETVSEYMPPFDDVFVQLVQSGGNHA
jgi:ABC-2 type transport system ATP-binding protein